MKTAWKWILGILIVLVVVAALVAVPMLARNYMFTRAAANPQVQQQAPQGWRAGPMMPGNQRGNKSLGEGGRFNMPMMGGRPMIGGRGGFQRGFGFFGIGFMFLGGLLRLVPLVLFGLLLWGIYELGKRAGLRSAAAPMTPAPSTPAPSVPAPDPSAPEGTNLPPVA